jgi:hypothetical protein
MTGVRAIVCGALVGAAAVLAAGAPRGGAAPVKDGDPVLIGTKWKGTLTQRGTFAGGGTGPPEFAVVLTVTHRDGNTFRADLREEAGDIKLTYVVKGEIARTADGKGYAVTFSSVEAKDVTNTAPILGVPYTGTLAGRAWKGTWKIPRTAAGTDVEGDFALELSK